MPTVVQSILLWAVIFSLSILWTLYALSLMLLSWWRHRGSFFRTEKHPRPAVLEHAEWRHQSVRLSKVQLHLVESGEPAADGEEKPLMLFLHGFPEFWYSWRFQLRHFRSRFRTVALDLRGYNDSDKPLGVANYDLDLLAGDIAELIERLGGPAILVGHDWGGGIAWQVAMERPDLVRRLVVMNCPHPKAFNKVMRTRSAQLLKSWYMFFFQCPWLPEIWMWTNDFAFLGQCFLDKQMGLVHREHFSAEDLEAWKHVFCKPNALTPPLNYYRAAMRTMNRRHFPSESVKPKTLVIWGKKDAVLELEGAQLSTELCRDARLETIEDASHWVQQDVPEKVNELMEQWLAE